MTDNGLPCLLQTAAFTLAPKALVANNTASVAALQGRSRSLRPPYQAGDVDARHPWVIVESPQGYRRAAVGPPWRNPEGMDIT